MSDFGFRISGELRPAASLDGGVQNTRNPTSEIRNPSSSVFPANDIGGSPFAPGLSIRAIADDVGLFAMLARKLVDVGMAPGIERDLLAKVGAVPLIHVRRLDAQGLEALF